MVGLDRQAGFCLYLFGSMLLSTGYAVAMEACVCKVKMTAVLSPYVVLQIPAEILARKMEWPAYLVSACRLKPPVHMHS